MNIISYCLSLSLVSQFRGDVNDFLKTKSAKSFGAKTVNLLCIQLSRVPNLNSRVPDKKSCVLNPSRRSYCYSSEVQHLSWSFFVVAFVPDIVFLFAASRQPIRAFGGFFFPVVIDKLSSTLLGGKIDQYFSIIRVLEGKAIAVW